MGWEWGFIYRLPTQVSANDMVCIMNKLNIFGSVGFQVFKPNTSVWKKYTYVQ